MTIEEIRQKYPEAKDYSDEKLARCNKSADILSRMFINYLERKFRLDNHEKTEQ